MEHSLCRPLVFKQSATNTQSFSLNSSTESLSLPWNQHDSYHEIKASDQIPHPLWLVIKCPPFRAGRGVKCPGYARGKRCSRFNLTGTLASEEAKNVVNVVISLTYRFMFTDTLVTLIYSQLLAFAYFTQICMFIADIAWLMTDIFYSVHSHGKLQSK